MRGRGGGPNLWSVFQMRKNPTVYGPPPFSRSPLDPESWRCAASPVETDLFSTLSAWQRTLHSSTLNVHVLMERCGGCCSGLRGEINEFSFSPLRPPASPLREGEVRSLLLLLFILSALSVPLLESRFLIRHPTPTHTPPSPLGLGSSWDGGCCGRTKCPRFSAGICLVPPS